MGVYDVSGLYRTGGVAEGRGGSKVEMILLFDPSTTPALRATPPVPGGELLLPLLQFIHTSIDRAPAENTE